MVKDDERRHVQKDSELRLCCVKDVFRRGGELELGGFGDGMISLKMAVFYETKE